MRHTECSHGECPHAHHFEGRGLDEDGLCEGAVRGLGDEDSLPGEDLDDAPVVEVVVVGVGVEVRQRQAVQLRVRQAVHDVRLQVLDALKGHRETNMLTLKGQNNLMTILLLGSLTS